MSEKKGLKSIVPPPELCKRIPQGNFADSLFALVRAKDGIEFIMYREVAKGMLDIIAPAPTLAEIMEADHRICIACSCDDKTWLANCWVNGTWTVRNDINPTTAAMKLWLAGNGVEVEK